MTNSDVQFKTNNEPWSQYKLEDGTILKLKIVLVRVIEEEAQDGMEGFGFAWNNVVGIIPVKAVPRKKATSKNKVDFKEIETAKNEYTIDSGKQVGAKIFIEPKVTAVSRTDKVDTRGEPIYNIQISPAITIEIKKSKGS